MIDCHVEFIGFPSGKVHEAITLNEDDHYTIFLDKNGSYEHQLKCYKHALQHIGQDDFDKTCVQKIESSTHLK